MPSKYIIISRMPIHSNGLHAALQHLARTDAVNHFVALEEDEILELRALDTLSNFAALEDTFAAQIEPLLKYLCGDVRRELLGFVEAPKPVIGALPDTPFLQLRHVEVVPAKMNDYLDWRNRTIFDVVRSHNEIESFLAYHSIISGQPGVMFLSGFSNDVAQYREIFASERYQKIVQEAGDSFITRGPNGLYTKLYRKL